MNILFCDNPFNNKTVDPDYEDEYIAAKENGFLSHLFSYEGLIKDKDGDFATRRIKHSNKKIHTVLYHLKKIHIL